VVPGHRVRHVPPGRPGQPAAPGELPVLTAISDEPWVEAADGRPQPAVDTQHRGDDQPEVLVPGVPQVVGATVAAGQPLRIRQDFGPGRPGRSSVAGQQVEDRVRGGCPAVEVTPPADHQHTVTVVDVPHDPGHLLDVTGGGQRVLVQEQQDVP